MSYVNLLHDCLLKLLLIQVEMRSRRLELIFKDKKKFKKR